MRYRLLLSVIAVLAAILVPVAPAHAAAPDDAKWTIQPSGPKGPTGGRNQFVYDLAPGEQIVDYIGVSNLGSTPTTFTVYATDAFNSADGAFALFTAEQKPKDVGTWVSVAKQEYTVPAGKRMDIPFTLAVPKDASPGDHAGGVIASVKVEETTKDGQRVLVDRRIATRVYLRVAGAMNPAAQVTAVDVKYDNPLQPFGGADMTVTYRIRNTGNLRLSGKATVDVSGPLGIGLGGAGEVAVPELLPGSEVTFTRTVEGVFPAGLLTASVRVTPVTIKPSATAPSTADITLAVVTRTASVWAVPWLIVVVLVLLIAAVIVWWRRRRGAVRSAGPAPVREPAAAHG